MNQAGNFLVVGSALLLVMLRCLSNGALRNTNMLCFCRVLFEWKFESFDFRILPWLKLRYCLY